MGNFIIQGPLSRSQQLGFFGVDPRSEVTGKTMLSAKSIDDEK